MGPGRWGSRGDIKLGVSVDYAGINNTAMLIEIARKRATMCRIFRSAPTSSRTWSNPTFATCRSTPTSRAASGIEDFLARAENLLPQLLPEHAGQAQVIQVVDVSRQAPGKVLRVLMNAESDAALAFLAEPAAAAGWEEDGGSRPRSRGRGTTGAGECAWPSRSPPAWTPGASG